jgi:hypothetical protein
MARSQHFILLVASLCLFGQIWAELNYNSIVSMFDSRYNTTDPYNPALLYQFGERQAVYYQIVTNVTDATFVDLPRISISYYNYIVPMGSLNFNYPGGINAANIGGVIDPCTFASPPSTAVLTFNGTTDAKEGQITCVIGALEVPNIQNGVTFEYTNIAVVHAPAGASNSFVSSRFYMLPFNVSETEVWGLEAASTEDVWLNVAGFGNCPTYKFTNNSQYWSGGVFANQTVATPVVAVKDKSFMWVQVMGQKAANVTLTWKQLPSSPTTPASEPVNGPSSAPGAPDNNDLPTWATALLVIFGLVIGVLLIIVIVMCVKNKRRSTYQGV